MNDVTANGVLLYVAGGTFDGSNADIIASPMATRPVRHWWRQPHRLASRVEHQPMSLCCSNTASADFDGTIYAPTADSAIQERRHADRTGHRLPGGLRAGRWHAQHDHRHAASVPGFARHASIPAWTVTARTRIRNSLRRAVRRPTPTASRPPGSAEQPDPRLDRAASSPARRQRSVPTRLPRR